MKRLLAFICAAAMLLAAVPGSAAFEWNERLMGEFEVYESFDSESIVYIKNAPGWTKAGTRGPYYQNGVMHMETVAGDAKDTLAYRAFTAISAGKAVIDFDIRVNEGGYFNIFTQQTDKKLSSRMASTLVNGKPKLEMQAGKDDGTVASVKNSLIDAMEYGTWYNISMVYDLDAQRVDYYVDSELKYSDARYFNNITLSDVAHLMFGATTNVSVTTRYDIKELKIGALSDLLALHYDSYNTAPGGLENVRDDLVLATSGKYGSEISWSSSDDAVISPDGRVDLTKAKGGADGQVVTLMASYSLNGQTYERSFAARVYAVDEEQVLLFDDFTEGETVSSVSNKNAEGVAEKTVADGKSVMHMSVPKGSTGNILLSGTMSAPAPYKAAAEIEFKTDAENVNLMFVQENATGKSLGRLLMKNGKLLWNGSSAIIIDENPGSGWHNVKALFDTQKDTVCIYYDNMLVQNDAGFMSVASGNEIIGYVSLFDTNNNQCGNLYIDYVKLYVPKNQEISDLVAGSLSLPAQTAGDIKMPAEGSWGAQISWESYDEDYITADGTLVKRPEIGEDAYSAELEATVTYGMGTSYVSRFVEILPREEIEYTYTVTNSDGEPISSLEGVDRVNLTLNMNINTDAAVNMFICAATYDAAGRLVSADSSAELLSGKGNTMTNSVGIAGTDAAYVKCYIWADFRPFVAIEPIR